MSTINSRDKRRKDERTSACRAFLDGWNWERLFSVWRNRLADFGVCLDPFFETIVVHDPAHPVGRDHDLSWWPVGERQSLQKALQRHFDKFPGTRGSIHPPAFYTRRGEIDTLNYIWDQKNDQEGIAAVLVSASLFARLESSRHRYSHEHWPPYECVKVLEKYAHNKWASKATYFGWHYACTQVIPVINDDYGYVIHDARTLVRYLAEEHAALLTAYRPVVIEFGPKRDPFIAKTLNEEYAAEERRRDIWEHEWKERQRREAAALADLRRKQPRWGDWSQLSREELERLVWTKPTRELAAEFGVSDVAIGKRCKVMEVKKPPPGFWNKVKAGKIAHPKGKPPS